MIDLLLQQEVISTWIAHSQKPGTEDSSPVNGSLVALRSVCTSGTTCTVIAEWGLFECLFQEGKEDGNSG